MDWLKKHFDRVILAVMAIIVIACAGLIISNALSFGDVFAQSKTPPRQNNDVPSPGTALVKQRISSIEKPKDWGIHQGSLFVSDPYVIKDNNDKPLNPLEDPEPLFPPIANKWIKDYNSIFRAPPCPTMIRTATSSRISRNSMARPIRPTLGPCRPTSQSCACSSSFRFRSA